MGNSASTMNKKRAISNEKEEIGRVKLTHNNNIVEAEAEAAESKLSSGSNQESSFL
ncbi:hypothetical protein COLO4_19772 [Corchorus olitorius]|uniref:Uncharacterized protein n=1 Tax=Corchorus olitorius TaxID=93759 RepID=A0A1R3J3I8_9ROSI|nr:hypothetical protein COLO4_19772 [Corchorus olitorius]